MPMPPPPDLDDKEAWEHYALTHEHRVEFGGWVQQKLNEDHSLKELHRRTGKVRSFFQQHLELFHVVPSLQDELTSGRLDFTPARELAKALKDDPHAQEHAAAWTRSYRQEVGRRLGRDDIQAYLRSRRQP